MDKIDLYVCKCARSQSKPQGKHCPKCGAKITIRPAKVDKVCVGYEGDDIAEHWINFKDFVILLRSYQADRLKQTEGGEE